MLHDSTDFVTYICFAITCFVMIMKGQDDEQMGQDDFLSYTGFD